ncbi:MAG: hypothetical protein NT027_09145, partial [Proteobacteria bacterium]|nr:hypothetical protein [Pseudomonadota bacterium]
MIIVRRRLKLFMVLAGIGSSIVGYWSMPAFGSGSVESKGQLVKEMIVLSVSKSDLRAELKTLPENGEEPKPIRS